MTLREAMNTYNPALFMIRSRGYEIEFLGENLWEATKEGLRVSAFNPLSLLALIIMAEEHGDNWRTICHEDIYDEILEKSINDG